MQIRQNLVSPDKYDLKCPYSMTPTEITFHNTYNDASADAEVRYMIRNNNATSFHIAVDDKEAVQGIPLNRNAWHSGDGNGAGNRKSIGVEICYSLSGGDRYKKAVQNAIVVIRQLMDTYGIPIERVKTHQERNGKYCPHRMLDEGSVDWFREQLANGGSNTPAEPQGDVRTPSGEPQGYLTTQVDVANIRREPSTSSQVMRQATRGQGHTYWDWHYDGSHFWFKVAQDNWMRDDTVSINKDGKSKGVVWVSGTNVNLRKGASKTDVVVNKITRQSAYDVHYRYENWIYVTGEGVEGWMYFDESYVKWIR